MTCWTSSEQKEQYSLLAFTKQEIGTSFKEATDWPANYIGKGWAVFGQSDSTVNAVRDALK